MVQTRTQLAVRVTPAIKKAIEKAAAADGRSVSRYVERLLTEHLREKGFLK